MVLIRVLFCGFGVSSVIVNELGTSHLSLKPDLAEQASVCVHSKSSLIEHRALQAQKKLTCFGKIEA